MNKLLSLLGVILLSLMAQTVDAEQATILIQSDAPLKIDSYTNRYKSPDRVGDGTVVHRSRVKNMSDQAIEGYGLGFYIFDSFKRDMGRPFVGYAMNNIAVDAFDTPGWEQRPNSAFLFEKNGHGLAYVSIVRLEDGTIWKADLNEISRQLEDFELKLTQDGEADNQ